MSNWATKIIGYVSGNGAEVTAAGEQKVLDTNINTGAGAMQVVYSAAGKTAGAALMPTPYGYIRSAIDNELFTDTFDTDDQLIKWNANVVAGTGTVTVSGSVLSLATGTTASNAAARFSRPSFDHRGFGYLRYGWAIQLENATIQTNTNRFWGKGNPNASFTAATPLATAQGFEIRTDGILYASIYSGNTAIFSQALTVPTDGLYHAYMMEVRSDIVFWYIDNFAVPVASAQFKVVAASQLPTRFHMINHTTPPAGAPTFNCMTVGIGDTGLSRASVSDGLNPWICQTVDSSHLAARMSSRPLDHTLYGHYTIGLQTGVLPAALAANSEIFQFRWADASRFAIITKVKVSACVSTTMFAAGVPVQIDMVKATGWSAAGTLGASPTIGTTLKKRTAGMGSSLVVAGDMRIATTAALGAGTKTLEANSLGLIVAPGPITASLNGQIIAPNTMLFEGEPSDGEYPLVLAQNEGFVIRSVAVPITGTWTLSVQVTWAEVAAY